MPLNPDRERIPNVMQDVAQWIVYRSEARANDTRLTKVPYNAVSGRKASVTDPEARCEFPRAWEAYERSQNSPAPFSGVGFVLTARDDFFAVDLDHCLDPATGQIQPRMLEIITRLDTYTEWSPSGEGMHLFGHGVIPVGRRRNDYVEMYDRDRYMTVTGHLLPGAPPTVNIRGREIAELHASIFGQGGEDPARTPNHPPPITGAVMSDEEVLAACRSLPSGDRFNALWLGDRSAYGGDDSAADMALANFLARWTRSPAQIDRLFRRSGLYREKWLREDYRERTIQEALAWGIAHGAPVAILTGAVEPPDPEPNPEAGPAFDGWEAPAPFGPSVLPLFPIEALPEPLRSMTTEASASIDISPDSPAMIGLSVCASCASHFYKVKIGETHEEGLNLFTVTAEKPGSRKSAAMDAMAAPLLQAEQDAVQAARPLIKAAAARRIGEEKRLDNLRTKASKETDETERKKLEEQAEVLAHTLTPIPPEPQYVFHDVTPEALGATMAAQPDNCIASFSAEGGLFGSFDRYTPGNANIDLILKAYSGEYHRVDRRGREPDIIRRPTLTLGLTIQPDVLESLRDNKSFRGRGLLARMLYSWPASRVGKRNYRNRPIAPEVRDQWHRAVRAMLALPATATPEDPGARSTIRLEGESLEVWRIQADAVEKRQAEGGDLAPISDWASKLPGAVARIAAGMHVLTHAERGTPHTNPISPATVAFAWEIGEYLIPHALAAFGQMDQDPARALAQRVMRWIARWPGTEFSFRDCYRIHLAMNDDLLKALRLLQDLGYIRSAVPERQAGQPGRMPSPRYLINPYWEREPA